MTNDNTHETDYLDECIACGELAYDSAEDECHACGYSEEGGME